MQLSGKGGFAPLFASLLLVANPGAAYDAFERTIPELQAAMARGETTAEELVRQYLARINAFDHHGPKLNTMLYINPRAIEEAAALDRERAAGNILGPLHGIPILLKDNYDTHDMPTTAGAIAMAGFVPKDDAYQVRRLREAGAVFIGKTNLHEFARGIETISSLGGQTLNPYDPERNPGGSSGGTAAAVAANFAAVGMGSDTCGSIRIPAANNNLFGLRVTQGLSNVDGIIPLSHTQDVAGPLARSMTDLATVLDVTVDANGRLPKGFSDYLSDDGLAGARLGLLTAYLRTSAPYGEVSKLVREAVGSMEKAGAEVIEINIDGLEELLRTTSVIDMEFQADVENYLKQARAPVQSLPGLLASGGYHAALEQRYRRSIDASEKEDEYKARLARRTILADLLTEAIETQDLDALVYPTLRVKPVAVGQGQYGSLCRIAAHSGLPAISLPAGFTPDGIPVGIELLARPFDDGRLVALGFAWEQLAKPRRPPPRTPSLVSDVLVHGFEIESASMSGRLTFDRPTQVLHYEFQFTPGKDLEIIDIKLHRGDPGSSGPVIELLGANTQDSVAIRNEYVDDLLRGRLYLVVYTKDAPGGAIHGQIRRQ
jgi:amidase